MTVLRLKRFVHRVSKILFAAQVAFRGVQRDVSEQKMNLVQLAVAT